MNREASDGDDVTLWDPLAAKRQRRRWTLLDCLNEFGEAVSLPDLADEVAIREADDPITEISPERVRDTYLSLYHSHIPVLVENNILEYDQESDVVRSASGVDLDDILDLGPNT